MSETKSPFDELSEELAKTGTLRIIDGIPFIDITYVARCLKTTADKGEDALQMFSVINEAARKWYINNASAEDMLKVLGAGAGGLEGLLASILGKPNNG